MAPDVALRELAGKVALRLVVEAMQRLVGPQATDIVLEALPGTLARRALPPAPRKQRKPPARKPGKPQTSAPPFAVDLTTKQCRKCWVHGPTRVPGTECTVKCTKCGFIWNVRAKRNVRAKTVARAAAGAPTVKAGACYRCDHPAIVHESGTGRCLEKRCVCQEFYS